jgi:hypothetical protein
MNRKCTILGVLVASLLLAGIAVAAPSSYDIDWWAMASGSSSGTAGDTNLEGTVGQTVVGIQSEDDYVICSGFWPGVGSCGEPPTYPAYLPTVFRELPSGGSGQE